MKRSQFSAIAPSVCCAVLSVNALRVFAGEPGQDGTRCGAHLRDFSRFQVCFGDPDTGAPGGNCAAFDFDQSGAVDLHDYASRTFVLRTHLSVFPARVQITYAQQVDFHAKVFESGNQAVNWSLRRVPGGEPGETLGTIDANGRYSPPSPSDLHAASEVIVEASRVGTVAAEFACVTIYGTLPARPPVRAVLPALGGVGGFVSNVTVADPPVRLVLPGPGGLEGPPVNVTVGSPPTAMVLPGQGDPDRLPPNVTAAQPPVALVLPGADEPEFFTLNTTVANPPVAVEFEDAP